MKSLRVAACHALLLCMTLIAPAAVSTTWAQTSNSPGETPPPVSSSERLPGTAIEVPDNYRLDTGDVILIDVLRHGDVSRTIRIPADGLVRLPRLAGPLSVRGKTCNQLIEEISGKLVNEGKLVLRPGQVNVSVTEMRMRRVYVRGNAGRTGEFDLKNGWRITELMAIIGTPAQPERVKARLLNPERPEPVTVNLSGALADPDSADNIALKEGDTLVLEQPRNKRFFVKGEGPRGMHELDERFGLRQTLIQLGFSPVNATGDLRNAYLYTHSVPGDPNSPQERKKVDLFALLTNDAVPEVPLSDMDTLEITPSQKFIYIYGEIAAPRKYYLPEDRPTFLVDVMALGGTSGRAKIDEIKIWRLENGKPAVKSYKFGKFLANGDQKQNPEIQPQDVVFVPEIRRLDPVSSIWTAFGLYNLLGTFVPGIRPPQ
jgi:protein involved in polysaccharide export with SLBB domain